MASVLPCSPTKLSPNETKPVISKDVLNSCKTVGELERLTSQYEMISELFRGLPEEPCDNNMAAKMKNELLEIEAGLQSLSVATKEAEELKADLKAMMDDIKEHIQHNIDTYLLNIAMQSSNHRAALENRLATPSKNAGAPTCEVAIRSDKGPTVRKGPVAFVDARAQYVDEESGESHETKVNQEQSSDPKPTKVTVQEFQSVPSHIRGRLTVERVNETLDMLRDVMQLKYRLVKKRKGLTMLEKDALLRMRSQIVPAVRECRFITEEDIFFFKQKKLPKSTLSHLIVLRHLHRLREVRDRNILRIVIGS